MTVVRASYTRGARGPRASRAAVRYAAHRADHAGDRQNREVFGPDGVVDEADAQERLKAAPGGYHYRLVLNQGAGHHDVDQQAWTRDVMESVENRAGTPVTWIAVEHRDHSDHDHVHVVAVLDRPLSRTDLDTLRGAAEDSWQRHASWSRAQDLDPATTREADTPRPTPRYDSGWDW